MGASFITNSGDCLDKDGDGYGVGPACLGPDADDNDGAVHSASDVIAKYGSMNAFLIHIGYQSTTNPATVWCISNSGSNSTGASSTNVDTACTTPFQTWRGAYSGTASNGFAAFPTQQYIVIFRGGTYTLITTAPSGTATAQNVIMQYPGELAVLDGSLFSHGAAISANEMGYVTWDGFKVLNAEGWAGGTYCVYPNSCPITAIGDVVRHEEVQGFNDGMRSPNLQNLLVEENVVHDANITTGSHSMYFGSNTIASSNVTIRRNILYNNYANVQVPAFQWNGRVTNLVFSQNLIHNVTGVGATFVNGVSNSFIESNLIFNTGYQAIKIFVYDGQCHVTNVPDICPYDETGNLFENNTLWVGTTTPGTTPYHSPGSGQTIDFGAIGWANSTTSASCAFFALTAPCRNLGGNRFVNNIIVGSGPALAGGDIPPIIFDANSQSYAATTTFTNNIFWNQDGASGDNFVLGYGAGPSFAFHGYTCSGAASLVIMSGCTNANPKFTAADPTYYTTPASFNFRLQSGSPAVGAGTSTGLSPSDLTGNTWNSPPSIGALEEASTGSAPQITSALTATGKVGSAFSYSVTGTNNPTSYGAGPLPPRLTVNTVTGVLTGTPRIAGTTQVTLSATNGAGTGRATLALTINPVVTPTITSTLTAYGQVGSAFSYTITADNSPTNFSATGLPGYLTLNTGTGAITGTPTATGTSSVTLSATNALGTSQTAALTLTIIQQTYASGWTDLGSGTRVQNVCPPNNANGNTYNFPAFCAGAIRSWSGGIADTKRNRLIMWGGGHTDYAGNEVYSLNLGASPPTLTRIYGPGFQVYANCGSEPLGSIGLDPSALSDGSPNSRHTYYNLTYIPTADVMYSFSGGLGNCGSHTNDTWTLNMSTLTWTHKDPVNGFNPYTPNTSTGALVGVSDYDPNTDTVFVAWHSQLLQYNWSTNTYTQLGTNTQVPYSAGGVIDSQRMRFWFFGAGYKQTALMAGYVDLTGSDGYVFHDITSSSSGCGGISPATRPADGAYPGLAYVPTIDKIVAWPVWGGNTVYVFNPDTLVCTTQTFSGGPANTSATGVFGRWRYFPSLNVIAVVNDYNQDAYVLNWQ